MRIARFSAPAVTLAAVAALAVAPASSAFPALRPAGPAQHRDTGGAAGYFAATPLIASNDTFGASVTSKELTGPIGLAPGVNGGGEATWVADSTSGTVIGLSISTTGNVTATDPPITVPGGKPAGIVQNTVQDSAPEAFQVAKDKPARLIVATGSGKIEAWAGPGTRTPFTVMATLKDVIFTGLAMSRSAVPKLGPELFAADPEKGTVDIFNRDFKLVEAPEEFKSPCDPGYVPYGIEQINGNIYVAYGKQADKKWVPKSKGCVADFKPNGELIKEIISPGTAGAPIHPWGMISAPAGFGALGGDLLVASADGEIDAVTSGALTPLPGPDGTSLKLGKLQGLAITTTTFGGLGHIAYTRAPDDFTAGVVGIIAFYIPKSPSAEPACKKTRPALASRPDHDPTC